MTLCFTFDPKRYRQLQSNIPRITFTCAAIAKNSLPPYLRHCFKFLEFLENYRNGKDNTDAFQEVPTEEIAPGYEQMIKKPVAFSTIREKILKEEYPNMKSFKDDIDLMWENCRTYNKPNEPLYELANRLQSVFNAVWKTHTSIKDPEEAKSAIKCLEETTKRCTKINQIVRATYVFPEQPATKKISTHDSTYRPRQTSMNDRNMDRRPTFTEPNEELLNSEMTTPQKYDLANKIDTMPIELLGGVLTILSEVVELNPNQEKIISFSELDNKTLRRIEAYVLENFDKEKIVRKMYNDKISADEQIKIINKELEEVQKKIKAKNIADTSDTASEASGYSSESDYSDTSQ